MFKFLTPDGATYFNDEPFVYNLPRRDEKWTRTEHPDPLTGPDGEPCGPGGLHLMKRLDARYAPRNWWPWWARPAGVVLGEDNEKARTTAVDLRRINRAVFHRALKPPFNWGRGADLYGADLRGADLGGADLGGADLGGAYLRGADLGGAYLRGADLRDADLGGANLGDADLGDADLRGADLGGAYLRGAYLGGADLGGADLRDADLRDACLGGACLGGARWNEFTRWPAGFTPPEAQ